MNDLRFTSIFVVVGRADIPFFRTLANSVVQQPLLLPKCIQRQRERVREIEKCFTNLILVLVLALALDII